jgi:hypothetical protein
MKAGALLFPVNTCYFERLSETKRRQGKSGALQHLGGGACKEQRKYKRAGSHRVAANRHNRRIFGGYFRLLQRTLPISAPAEQAGSSGRTNQGGGRAFADACRSLQIPRPRGPKRIYGECAATYARTRADFAPPLARVSAEFGPS